MMILSALLMLEAMPQLETFQAPGFEMPVVGVWYAPGEAKSALPLGALGTGFVDFTSSATFGANTCENNWLNPRPSANGCGIEISVGERTLRLFPDAEPSKSIRFWGHFPMADVSFGDAFGPVDVRLRAFAPLIPHDYERSEVPAALFHVALTNHGSSEAPASVALQWQASLAQSAEGNVEGAFGWKRDVLRRGETWSVPVTLLFAANRQGLKDVMPLVSLDNPALEGTPAPEGTAYQFDGVKDFLLDAFCGFNWETHRRHSLSFKGAGNIGQLLWQTSYGGGKAGRGLNGPFGFQGDRLPATTQDGALSIDVRPVSAAARNAVGLVFLIKNVGGSDVQDLRLGFALNADLGGPGRAEKQRAEFVPGLCRGADTGDRCHGIVFEDPGLDYVLALVARPDDFCVSTWPQAHQAMQNGQLLAATSKLPVSHGAELAQSIQLDVPAGSYALGADPSTGWMIRCSAPEDGIVRVNAAGRMLAAGETTDFFLALAWCFPSWVSSDGQSLRHRYASAFKDAGAVLNSVLPHAKEIEDRIIARQAPIYASKAPALLKDAVINGLYILARNSWWLDDGRYFQSESFTGCPITETFVCRYYGSFPLALLWPECERATMRAVAKAQSESGEIPFGFGSPLGSRSPMFHCQHPIVSSKSSCSPGATTRSGKTTRTLRKCIPSSSAPCALR